MDISAEIAAIQAASQGSELRQPLVGALNKLNSSSLPAITASDVGKILKVGANGWELGEKSGYMPVPTATKQITENGTYDVTNYANAQVYISGDVIPSGYTKIPYIESSGDKYIETDILSQLPLNINIEFSLYDPNAKGYSALLTAGDPSNGYARYYFGVLLQNNEAKFSYRFSNYPWEYARTINTASDHYKYIVDTILSGNNLLAIDINNDLYTGSINNDIVLGKKIYLLANPPVFSTESFGQCRLYSFEMSTQDEVLFHGIPVVDNNTNKTGLYDIVNSSFLPLQDNV